MGNDPADALATLLGHFGDLKAIQGNLCLIQAIRDFSAVWRFVPSASILKARDMQNAPADALAMILGHLGDLKAVKVTMFGHQISWKSLVFGVLGI